MDIIARWKKREKKKKKENRQICQEIVNS